MLQSMRKGPGRIVAALVLLLVMTLPALGLGAYLSGAKAAAPPLPSTALPAVGSTSLVISQVYGGGGNSGALYTNDFIELFNPTSSPVVFTNWSVQYASATGAFTTTNVTVITGTRTLQPGQYFLVQEAAGAGGTQPLPSPDSSGSIAMSATAGKVALVNNSTALSCTPPACHNAPGVVDFVGYGTNGQRL